MHNNIGMWVLTLEYNFRLIIWQFSDKWIYFHGMLILIRILSIEMFDLQIPSLIPFLITWNTFRNKAESIKVLNGKQTIIFETIFVVPSGISNSSGDNNKNHNGSSIFTIDTQQRIPIFNIFLTGNGMRQKSFIISPTIVSGWICIESSYYYELRSSSNRIFIQILSLSRPISKYWIVIYTPANFCTPYMKSASVLNSEKVS